MKLIKNLLLLLLLVVTQIAEAQKDESLEKRLKDFLAFNDSMQIEKVLEYTYPKLYTLVPKKQMLEVMQQAFNNEQMTISMDSLKAEKIHPVFTMGGGSYAKIDYSLKMTMQFKDKTTNTKDMVDIMKAQFAEVNAMDNGVLVIKQVTAMVAIKDALSKEWTFMNLKENDPLTDQLISKALQAKLATFK